MLKAWYNYPFTEVTLEKMAASKADGIEGYLQVTNASKVSEASSIFNIH